MSLLERILKNNQRVPCEGCKYLIWPKENLPFCKIKDKIILIEYPPNKCEVRVEEEEVR